MRSRINDLIVGLPQEGLEYLYEVVDALPEVVVGLPLVLVVEEGVHEVDELDGAPGVGVGRVGAELVEGRAVVHLDAAQLAVVVVVGRVRHAEALQRVVPGRGRGGGRLGRAAQRQRGHGANARVQRAVRADLPAEVGPAARAHRGPPRDRPAPEHRRRARPAD